MSKYAFYVKAKSTDKILDILPAVNQKAKIARMESLSNNFDSVRQYGFTATFYYSNPLQLVALEGENLGEDTVSRFSMAVKSVDLPDFSARVSHSAMLGFSGQTINYHVDKKLKLKVDELTQDLLLHKLRSVGLFHQLGDSESQIAKETDIKTITKTKNIPLKPVLKPANTGPYGPNPGFQVAYYTLPQQVNYDVTETTIETRKVPHYSFDLRLSKYFNNGQLHSILDFIGCKIVGFKQSQFSYTVTNAMSEIEFDLVFDELISVPPTGFEEKIPSEVANYVFQETANLIPTISP